jgi:hypothetical protein
MTTVERWDTSEFVFTAARSYANPFRDVDLRATWTHVATDRKPPRARDGERGSAGVFAVRGGAGAALPAAGRCMMERSGGRCRR